MKPSATQLAKPVRMQATVKLIATAYFYDDGSTDLITQAVDAVGDGEFSDIEILDVSDIEEVPQHD